MKLTSGNPSRGMLGCGLLVAVTLFVTASAANGMYDPKHGRWLQRDPLGVRAEVSRPTLQVQAQYGDGANLHEYARSTPQRLVDPDGTSSAPTPPSPKGPAPPTGTDCGVRVERSPLCLEHLNFQCKNLGHTWIVKPGGDTVDFPPDYIEGDHGCQKDYVEKEWKTKTSQGNNRSCAEISQCLQYMEDWWRDHYDFSLFGRTCRDFSGQALSACGLKREEPPDKYDKTMYKKYCCSPCAKMKTRAKYRHPRE